MSPNIIANVRLIALFIITFILSININVIANASDVEGIKQFINNTADSVIAIIEDGNINSADKEKRLIKLFEDTVDIGYMAKMAAGHHIKNISAEEQNRYFKAYHNYLISLYVPKFRDNNKGHYKIGNIQKQGDDYAVNIVIFDDKSGKNYNIGYIISNRGVFLIRDIIAEGVSLITTQRADFSSIMDNGGFNNLVNVLEQKVKNAEKHDYNEEDMKNLSLEINNAIKKHEEKENSLNAVKSKAVGIITHIALDCSIGLIIGSFIGFNMDKYFGTIPLFLFILSLLGLAGGWYSCYKEYMRGR